MLTPAVFTIRAMYNRLGISKYGYSMFDLPLDAKILESIIGTILTVTLTTDEFIT